MSVNMERIKLLSHAEKVFYGGSVIKIEYDPLRPVKAYRKEGVIEIIDGFSPSYRAVISFHDKGAFTYFTYHEYDFVGNITYIDRDTSIRSMKVRLR